MQSPIPLGGIVAKRKIDEVLLKKINSLIKQSINYSFDGYPAITEYVRANSQEMDEEVMRKHIDLYVNDYSINLGEKGRKAVSAMLNVYKSMNPVNTIKQNLIFLG